MRGEEQKKKRLCLMSSCPPGFYPLSLFWFDSSSISVDQLKKYLAFSKALTVLPVAVGHKSWFIRADATACVLNMSIYIYNI